MKLNADAAQSNIDPGRTLLQVASVERRMLLVGECIRRLLYPPCPFRNRTYADFLNPHRIAHELPKHAGRFDPAQRFIPRADVAEDGVGVAQALCTGVT